MCTRVPHGERHVAEVRGPPARLEATVLLRSGSTTVAEVRGAPATSLEATATKAPDPTTSQPRLTRLRGSAVAGLAPQPPRWPSPARQRWLRCEKRQPRASKPP